MSISSGPNAESNGTQVPPPTVPRSGPRIYIEGQIIRGLGMFILAGVAVLAGLIGYLRYDEYIDPNLPIFVCCVPSVVVATILMFFGLARRWTPVQQVKVRNIPPPTQPPQQIRKEPASSISKDKNAVEKKKSAKKIRKRQSAEPLNVRTTKPLQRDSPATKEEIEEKKKHLKEFLKNLRSQYNEGLLMEETYLALKHKNMIELHELEKLQRRMK